MSDGWRGLRGVWRGGGGVLIRQRCMGFDLSHTSWVHLMKPWASLTPPPTPHMCNTVTTIRNQWRFFFGCRWLTFCYVINRLSVKHCEFNSVILLNETGKLRNTLIQICIHSLQMSSLWRDLLLALYLIPEDRWKQWSIDQLIKQRLSSWYGRNQKQRWKTFKF